MVYAFAVGLQTNAPEESEEKPSGNTVKTLNATMYGKKTISTRVPSGRPLGGTFFTSILYMFTSFIYFSGITMEVNKMAYMGHTSMLLRSASQYEGIEHLNGCDLHEDAPLVLRDRKGKFISRECSCDFIRDCLMEDRIR